MDGYNAYGVEDDRLKQAARRILHQYKLEQSDRSEDSASATDATGPALGIPDSINTLRLALDEMGMRLEHIQRLMANRENLFMAALERMERNQAKSDGLLDALTIEVARIASGPALDMDGIKHDRQTETAILMQEFSNMMSLSRTLLEETQDIFSASISAAKESKLLDNSR